MSATFSFSRLGKLIAKQFFENFRFYVFSVLALTGLMAIVFAFWLSVAGKDYRGEELYLIFTFGLFISGSIFSSISFNMLGSKEKGLYWLLTPATHFEKFVCTILYTTIAFTAVYCLCFFAVKSVSISILLQYIKSHPENSYIEADLHSQGFRTAAKYMTLAYFAVQSLYLLGSVYFKRYAFIVTTVAVSAIIFVLVLYISTIERTMDGNWHLVSLTKYPGDDGSYREYSVSPAIINALKFTAQFIWVPVFWVVTWFRLKEKEI